MDAGSVFRIPAPGASLDSHFWFILSDPKLDAGRVLIVNLTSWRQDKDQACLLDVGDHGCVRHRSCVNYEGAKTPSLKDLHKLKDSGLLEELAPLTPAVLQKIRNAVPNSRMKLGHAKVLEEQGLVEE